MGKNEIIKQMEKRQEENKSGQTLQYMPKIMWTTPLSVHTHPISDLFPLDFDLVLLDLDLLKNHNTSCPHGALFVHTVMLEHCFSPSSSEIVKLEHTETFYTIVCFHFSVTVWRRTEV